MPILHRRMVAVLIPLTLLGCSSGGGEASSSNATSSGSGMGPAAHPNYAEDVAPILAKNCAGCHHDGGIAPFSLLTYDQARMAAGAMKGATQSRVMPPFNLDNSGACNTYADARWLDDADIATIGAWVDAGTPEGDPAKAPPPPAPPAGLEGKNLTLDMGVTYTPDPSLTDEYRCFIIDPGLAVDKFFIGYDVKSGDPRVVHHAILFGLDTATAEQDAAALDAADPKDGYLCFGGPGVTSSRFLVGWAPGSGATDYPANTGVRVLGGHKMVLQIHYNMANGSFPDRTTIDLRVADSVAKEAAITRVSTKGMTLPPGQTLVTASGQANVPLAQGDITVWGVGPHMHTRGKTQDAWYDLNGQKTCLSQVKDWNFHWQSLSTYSTPLTLKAGGTLNVTCGFDTSHDTMTVKQGESTSDEMCIDFLYVTR